jgi:hypothetical protein
MFGFRKNKNNYSNGPRLVDVVEKIEDNGHGAFVDINNDLGRFVEDDKGLSDIHKMAYAYARRVVAAGMVLQGIMPQSHYDYVYKVFISFQGSTLPKDDIKTEDTVEFQEQAAKQAYELILSYTNLFDAKGLKLLCNLVHLGNAETPNNGEVLSIEELAKLITHVKNKSV